MKIRLPNPTEHSIDDFFEQLELCVYHAKKSWEKIKKKYTQEELEDENSSPFLAFRNQFLWDNYDNEIHGYTVIDGGHDQVIDIEIGEN